jgi:uncharacterized membrane protein YeaQ/YmgE (transglycosylase-associated protein family)
MDFAISLGLGGWLVLIVGAVVFGVVAQNVGEARMGYEWLVDAIAAGIGALVASEFVIAWRAFEPVFDGLALVPALLGGSAPWHRRRGCDASPDGRDLFGPASGRVTFALASREPTGDSECRTGSRRPGGLSRASRIAMAIEVRTDEEILRALGTYRRST